MAVIAAMGTTRGHSTDAANDKVLLGRAIARARNDRGLTQAALARRLGLKQTSVSEWERGASFPDIAIWARLAYELDLSPHDLAEVLWGPHNRDDTGHLLSIGELAAHLETRVRELSDSVVDRSDEES